MTQQVIDLATLDTSKAQDEGIEVTILHPKTEEPLGITIRVAGVDSDRAKRARREILDRRIRKRKRSFTAKEIEDDELQQLAAQTISWTGVVIDGKEIELTPDSAAALYRRFPFIKRQVDVEAGDIAGFLKS